jgi:endoglucanase
LAQSAQLHDRRRIVADFIRRAYGQSKTLSADTRFFVPVPPNGAVQQVESELQQRQLKNALLITAMETVPQAVWLTSGTPSQVSATLRSTLRQANVERAVPVLVLYNIPGRDCGSYSAGGAQNTADYEGWIDAIATAIADQKAVIVLEPDALADLPSDCGYDPTQVNIPQATADRYTQISYAVTKLETGSQTLVYLDAGNSHWQAVPVMASRLAQARIQQAQGFFTNVSNYNPNNYESKYDTWVSECIAFANNPDNGGWRLASGTLFVLRQSVLLTSPNGRSKQHCHVGLHRPVVSTEHGNRPTHDAFPD